MAAINPNSCSQPITKVFEKIRRFTTKSGKTVEVRWAQEVTLDGNNFTKREIFESPNVLGDSRNIEDLENVRVCCVCDELYSQDSVSRCAGCGGFYDKNCAGDVEKKTSDGIKISIPMCKLCAEEANAGVVKKAWWKIWDLNR